MFKNRFFLRLHSFRMRFIKPLTKIFLRKKSSPAKIDQLRYLSQSALIEESTAPHMVRTTLILVSIVIIALVVWASFTEIEEIAVTEGEVIPSKHIQSIQHLEGGIVNELRVQEGDLVDRNEILLVLDGTSAVQDLEALKARKLNLLYNAHRYRSFINKTIPDFGAVASASERDIIAEQEQQKAHDSMIEARESEKDVVEQQILQKKEDLTRMETKKNNLYKNLALVEEEQELKRQLMEKGHLSRFKYLQIKKEYNELKDEYDETNSAINQAKNLINEFAERLESMAATHIDEAFEELNKIEAEIAQVQENKEKLEAQVSRLEIRSPTFGFVKSLNIKTIGGVIGSGEVLAEIVPLEGILIVETKILPKDIGHVKTGQEVKVKVSSYDFSRYGSIGGTLDYISPTTFIDEEGGRYYLGRVNLEKKYVGEDPTRNLILPGMTVQADIKTGSKTILAYLLKPIHTSLTTAFTER